MSQFSASLLPTLGIIAALLVGLLLVGKVPVRYNLRNLIVRWRTTVVTGLAFTLVISLLIVMLAFVNGMYRLTASSGRADNILLLALGAQDEAFSNLSISDTGEIESQTGIARLGNKPLCSKETYLVINQPIENARPGQPRRRFLQVRGIDDPEISAEVHDIELYEGGEWFSPAGVEASQDDPAKSRIQVVLGEGIARELARDPVNQQRPEIAQRGRLDVGDTYSLANEDWIVVGIMQSGGRTFDSEVWAKRTLVGPRFGKPSYSSLLVRAESPTEALRLKDLFAGKYKQAALDATLETEYFEKLSGTNRQFLGAIIVLAIVMAMGGMFGVMNTMFAAISQRIKDIGVLQILGYARWQILVSFLLESLVLALVGGLLGCALGYLCDGWTATSIVGSGQGGGKSIILKLSVDSQVLGAGLALTLIMGLLGGVLPALSAMRLKPLDALK